MAGYSGTPLAQKLGFKPGQVAVILAAPPNYRRSLGPLPDVTFRTAARGAGALDLVQLFTKRRRELAAKLPALKHALAPAGALWVSWPKQASGVATDITENVVRELALAAGLVDVKVCAVDEVWSGLKLVRRLKDRRTD